MQRQDQPMKPLAHFEHVAHRMPMKSRAALRRAADIATTAKRASTAGDYQHAYVVGLAREIDRRAHLLDHRLVVSVHPLSAVDCDLRDLVARIIDDRLEVHRLTPLMIFSPALFILLLVLILPL